MISWATQETHRIVWVLRVLAALLFLGGWEATAHYSTTIQFSLGSPSSIAREFGALAVTGELWRHAAITGGEAGLGWVMGVVAGSAVGLCFWLSPLVAKAAQPLLVMFGNAPVFAFGPMLIIWLGVGTAMKVALAFYFVFFFTVALTHEGADRVSKDLEDVYRIFGGSRVDAFRKVIVPGALDAVLSATRRSVALALLGAFVGEFFASSSGLGYVILRSAGVFNMPRAMAAGVAFVLLALAFDALGSGLQARRAGILQALAVPRPLRTSHRPRR